MTDKQFNFPLYKAISAATYAANSIALLGFERAYGCEQISLGHARDYLHQALAALLDYEMSANPHTATPATTEEPA